MPRVSLPLHSQQVNFG